LRCAERISRHRYRIGRPLLDTGQRRSPRLRRAALRELLDHLRKSCTRELETLARGHAHHFVELLLDDVKTLASLQIVEVGRLARAGLADQVHHALDAPALGEALGPRVIAHDGLQRPEFALDVAQGHDEARAVELHAERLDSLAVEVRVLTARGETRQSLPA